MAVENTPQSTGGSDLESRFKAFVSYSHADKAAAQKLHRKLETYRLPKHLRNKASDTAGSDGRIGAIFRDREDLPAAEDLSESVKAALSASEALVVICSPDAQKSPWVAREIELFREIHPDRPVLAAILRGEPAEAFPAPLGQGREPLAADLRKEGDGPRLGFLKIVAGIAGVPLDALINRDAQRRVRRVTAITVAALAAMVVMALMTTFALQARNEARDQRAEAEGLVEYMITDLRGALRGVGRLDVMRGVNERAMAYYAARDNLGEMEPSSLERSARILHAMGEDDIEQGDLDSALAKFKRAHEVTGELLKRDRKSADRIFGHAQSEYWVGRIHELRKNGPAALARYQAYQALAMQLAVIGQDDFRSLVERGYAENNLGIVALRLLDDPEKAEGYFRNAIGFFERAAGLEPTDFELKVQLSNAITWTSDSQFFQQKWDEAKRFRLKEQLLLESLRVFEPDNRNLQYRALVNRNALNEIRRATCRCPIEKSWDPELTANAQALAALDRSNKSWAEISQVVIENLVN